MHKTIAAYVPDATDLAGFREVQRLAYRCAEETAATLRAGMTEKDVAAQMKTWLLDHGVTDWCHQPFVWFGDRTAFTSFSGLGHLRGFNPAFYPGNRGLEESMAYILDMVKERRLLSEVSQALGAHCMRQGYAPRHHGKSGRVPISGVIVAENNGDQDDVGLRLPRIDDAHASKDTAPPPEAASHTWRKE